MPAMPSRFPRRAVDGCDRPFNARMKHTDATRYQSATWLALIGTLGADDRSPRKGDCRACAVWRSMLRRRLARRLPALEHVEHPLRDEEAAEHVDRRQRNRQHADPPAPVEC